MIAKQGRAPSQPVAAEAEAGMSPRGNKVGHVAAYGHAVAYVGMLLSSSLSVQVAPHTAS